ncbi:MAG: hypothetical protein JW716_05150 [Candidatus Aenigmarchaeota archaeon]|nr:hypothetical protein [Candidatus Aenigmarchaeota archaeon]
MRYLSNIYEKYHKGIIIGAKIGLILGFLAIIILVITNVNGEERIITSFTCKSLISNGNVDFYNLSQYPNYKNYEEAAFECDIIFVKKNNETYKNCSFHFSGGGYDEDDPINETLMELFNNGENAYDDWGFEYEFIKYAKGNFNGIFTLICDGEEIDKVDINLELIERPKEDKSVFWTAQIALILAIFGIATSVYQGKLIEKLEEKKLFWLPLVIFIIIFLVWLYFVLIA